MSSLPKKINEKYIQNLYEGDNYIDLKKPIKSNKKKRKSKSIINEDFLKQETDNVRGYLLSRNN